MEIQQKLTRKEQAFVKYMVNNLKSSATEAALYAYNTTSRSVAAAIGYENLRKPHIQTYMQSIDMLAQDTIVQTVREWGHSQNPGKRELAVRSAYYIHDRVHSKN